MVAKGLEIVIEQYIVLDFSRNSLFRMLYNIILEVRTDILFSYVDLEEEKINTYSTCLRILKKKNMSM